MSVTAHRYRVALERIEPPIWRQIQVPETYSFWDLHVAIQDAMGWLDYHLHEFRVRNPKTGRVNAIGIPSEDEFGPGPPTLAGWDLAIADYFTKPGDSCEYNYDFGDDWRHSVEFEGISDLSRGEPALACLNGERACPPEDCGGIFGYQELLEAVRSPQHPQHKELMEWLGGGFDPESFSPSAVQFDDPKERWRNAFSGAV